jgi:hypothetical protein
LDAFSTHLEKQIEALSCVITVSLEKNNDKNINTKSMDIPPDEETPDWLDLK